MRAPALAVTSLSLALAAAAPGQTIGGPHTYPQFRVFSGLPGGGYGLLKDGVPSIDGAAALVTPIGYTLAGHGAASLFNTSHNLDPFILDQGSKGTGEEANGTFALSYGGSFHGFQGSAGYMVLSSKGDGAFNFQVSPPLEGRLGVAFGVQDVGGGGGASGTGLPGDSASSRSFYGAATYDWGKRIYTTVGVGDRRFKGVFGNASAPLGNRFRALVEYDTFNWNAGVIYGSGPLRDLGGFGAKIQANIFLGLVAGKYGTVGLTLTF